jgi:cellulose synthase/poly-beta-1,6-N-acetylglucosamine synthase-like glycosyltransferase
MDGSDPSHSGPARGPGGTGPRAATGGIVAPLPRRQRQPRSATAAAPGLGQILLDRGVVDAEALRRAHAAQVGTGLPVGDILLAQNALGEAELLAAQAECHGIGVAHLAGAQPDPELAALLPVAQALALGAVPWRRVGSAVVIAMTRPDLEADLRAALPGGTRLILTLAPRSQVLAAQTALYGERLARVAEGQAPLSDSCRRWRAARAARLTLAAAAAFTAAALAAPAAVASAVFLLAFTVFLANMTLKAAAFAAALRQRAAQTAAAASPALLHLPTITLLIPLYHEREIASTLIARLQRLSYPRERLDVILAVEADDALTQAAIAACSLPAWIRTVQVPPGAPRTKPRALNFALNFARGQIVGIYDAEDRPAPDQLHRVAARFATLPPEVACLQGRLDYYNSRHNWLARCFTIEYASWFRILLPGVQRLGLFVPLGGTTLFLRRDVLRDLGGWDAHNVTEDAELGLRLARRGYRTEMVDTTTHEEANAALRPWIAQRARWQKGYLMTWAMAMRRPRQLLVDLGLWRFAAFQVQVLFAVLGFLLAPVLWSLLAIPFGLPHPVSAMLSGPQIGLLVALLVSGTVLSLAIALAATRAAHLRGLRPWVLTVEFYYLCATLSAWRAVSEMLLRPFWWAKTRHGGFGGAEPPGAEEPAQRAGGG